MALYCQVGRPIIILIKILSLATESLSAILLIVHLYHPMYDFSNPTEQNTWSVLIATLAVG